jgi:hypothetical protein
MNESFICPKGEVEIIINGKTAMRFSNTILRKGREALALSLSNDFGDSYDFFVSRMLFGNGGTAGNVPKSVNTEREGLFGTTVASKPVISTIDPNLRSQVVFTSVLSYNEANDQTLNEMALRMNNEDLYSMATFADLTKTSSMQITWVWRISMV